jgi:hypothetical protein
MHRWHARDGHRQIKTKKFAKFSGPAIPISAHIIFIKRGQFDATKSFNATTIHNSSDESTKSITNVVFLFGFNSQFDVLQFLVFSQCLPSSFVFLI